MTLLQIIFTGAFLVLPVEQNVLLEFLAKVAAWGALIVGEPTFVQIMELESTIVQSGTRE